MNRNSRTKDNEDIATVETEEFNSTDVKPYRFIRQFDIKRGLLTEGHWSGNDVGGMRLMKIESIDKKELKKLRQEFEQSLTRDNFRIKAYSSFLTSESHAEKKRAIFQLASVKDETLLPDIYSNLKKASKNDSYFQMMFGNLLSKHVETGAVWALEFLLSKKWPESEEEDCGHGMPVSSLSKLSGLPFSWDQNMWSLWLKRVKGALPKLGNSETEALKQHAYNKDPWVRLFALKQLWNRLLLEERQARENMELATIFQMTSQDEDNLVREFSTKTLKKLRNKDKDR